MTDMIAEEQAQGLPASVSSLIDYLAGIAAGYGYLKWNEQAKLKADMMNSRPVWARVEPSALEAKCLDAGLTAEETTEIVGWLAKIQAGRRLVPERSYRSYAWPGHSDMPPHLRDTT